MTDINACTFELYQRTDPYPRYFCKVIGGEFGWAKQVVPVFKPIKDLYDIPLNGSGKNKALKKVEERLKSDGLDLILLENTSELVILDRE